MLEHVKKYIDKTAMISCGDKIIAACSGGTDSLAMTHMLADLREYYRFELRVAHINHMFRPESEQEADFVCQWSKDKGLIYDYAIIDVPSYVRETGVSAQEAARILRYRYLDELACKWGNAKIAVAHHRDDQVETVLLNLLRGSGPAGLAGMKPINGSIIRPLLGIERRMIEEYCNIKNITPVQDKSNFSTKYLRNRIRLELLPFLEKDYNPSLRDAIYRMAQIIGDEHEYVETMALKAWNDIAKVTSKCISLDIKLLLKLPTALQRKIFLLTIEKKQGHLKGISFEHVERLAGVALNSSVGSVVELPNGLKFRKDYAELVLEDERDIFDAGGNIGTNVLSVPGAIGYCHGSITATVSTELTHSKDAKQAIFDYDKISLPLIVRGRRKGDSFKPPGMNGTKKVKDFYIDSKIPRYERDSIPLVCDGKEILWIAGYRQSRYASIDATTKRFLKLVMNTEEKQYAGRN